MNILLVSAESFPYGKASGLGDVVPGLGKELYNQNHDVRIAVPCYRGALDRTPAKELVCDLDISLGTYYSRLAHVWRSADEPTTYLIQDDHDFYFGRNDIYGYMDDYERYIFFARAAMEMLISPNFRQVEKGWFPDIIQGYDWFGGIIPAWLPAYQKSDERFINTHFVLCIHNIRAVRIFGRRALRVAKQEEIGIFKEIGEDAERINFLGRGILLADKVVTENPKYDSGNPLPESARSLINILENRLKQKSIIGIRNAIDPNEFDPSNSNEIIKPFKENSLKNRVMNKLALQKELGFEKDKDIPLLGMITRLIPAKGIQLFQSIKDALLAFDDLQLVILADPGVAQFREMFEEWEKTFRIKENREISWLKVYYGFDEKLARQIYASSDIFMIPSKEEPSGIQHFIAMRYGAVPLVHQTGVLKNSIIPYQGPDLINYVVDGAGVGFTFEDFDSAALLKSLREALAVYKKSPLIWFDIQLHNFHQDFSWYEPAKQFVKLYKDLNNIEKQSKPILSGVKLIPDKDAELLQALLEIDSLPGLAKRDSRIMLQQAARLVRYVIECDAIYVWAFSEGIQTTSSETLPEAMELVSQTLARDEDGGRTPPDKSKVSKLLNRSAISSWYQASDLNISITPSQILGLEDSDLANSEQWVNGKSVLITAHSRVLGRIDVLFRPEQILSEDARNEIWIDEALTKIALAYGSRLESIRMAQESDLLREASDKLLQIHSFDDAVNLIIQQAKEFSHADSAWLYLDRNGKLQAIEPSPEIESTAGLSIAKISVETAKPHYIPDWSTALDGKHIPISFRSLMAIPLAITLEENQNTALGVLEIAKEKPAAFSHDVENTLVKWSSQAAATLQTALWHKEKQLSHEQRDRQRAEQLGKLASSLVGGSDLASFLQQVVKTTAEALEVQAASLYLLNPQNKLEIRAAYGYHEPLFREKESANVIYGIGEGITGWIAAKNQILVFENQDKLHNHPAWKGKYTIVNPIYTREPRTFLGIPLSIVNPINNQKHVIGVLKFEDREKSESPRPFEFSNEDVHLGEMMANVIATVVYNTQVSNAQLQTFSSNLGELSKALAGGREMRELVDQVVETMARVLHAEGSSLYLVDDATGKLVIQAATGYQKQLVEKHVTYRMGEGITGWIADRDETFRARNKTELQAHPNWKGKHDSDQGGRVADSWLGLPLRVVDRSTGQNKVIGVLKVEDIVPSENHPEKFFTDQDELLVTMMANVIATVIYNTRQGEAHVGDVLRQIGTLSKPEDAELALRDFAHISNTGLLDQLAKALAIHMDAEPEQVEAEAKALYEVGADPLIYERIASWAKNDQVRWEFSLIHTVLTGSRTKFANWNQVINVADPWLHIKRSAANPTEFGNTTKDLVRKVAEVTQLNINNFGADSSETWFGIVLDTEKLFGRQVDCVPILFHRQQVFSEDDLERMQNFAQRGLNRPYQVLILVLWEAKLPDDQIRQIQTRMRIHAMDVVVAGIADILQIIGSPNPGEALRSIVLRQMTTTSPFVIVGPVPDAMFFGRERELREIIQYLGAERSVMVIGGRRIGKTSILARLYRVRLPGEGFRVLYHDCSTIQDFQQFLSTFIREWRPDPPTKPIKTFGDLLQSPPMDKPLVLLLDEADKLVPFDRSSGWQLFNRLRDLTNSGQIKIVLSGERILREASHDDTSPLFNLFNEFLLERLGFDDVSELVTRPFQQLEIKLVDKDAIVRRIYDITSGHPNVVQRLCRRLIERLNEKQKQGVRQITLDDVNRIIADPAFQRDDFLDTYFATATPLEKIIALLMANDSSVRTLATVEKALLENKLTVTTTEIDNAIQRLVDLRSILKRAPDGYKFAVEAFPHVVAGRMTSDDMLRIFREEYTKNNPQE
jgi:starch synthase